MLLSTVITFRHLPQSVQVPRYNLSQAPSHSLRELGTWCYGRLPDEGPIRRCAISKIKEHHQESRSFNLTVIIQVTSGSTSRIKNLSFNHWFQWAISDATGAFIDLPVCISIDSPMTTYAQNINVRHFWMVCTQTYSIIFSDLQLWSRLTYLRNGENP